MLMAFWAIFVEARKILCPSCSKNLAYFFYDINYTKHWVAFSIPDDLPEDISKCPNCKTDCDEEIKETQNKSAVGNSVPSDEA